MLKVDRSPQMIALELEREAINLKKSHQTRIKLINNVLPKWACPVAEGLILHSKSLTKLAKTCNALLDRVEKISVKFTSDPLDAQQQNALLENCLNSAKAVCAAFTQIPTKGKEKQQYEWLTQKLAALQYRMELVNGGLDPKLNADALTEVNRGHLHQKAIEWKKANPLMINHDLTEKELQQLEETLAYPEFVKILLASKELEQTFFGWALRDCNGVSQFIQFPATCARLKSAYLAARVGRLGSSFLPIEKEKCMESPNITEKLLKLPFYIHNQRQFISILDESKEVELAKGWRLTIGKIMDIFAKKNDEIGNLDFFASTGITNWNGHKLGSWNPQKQTYDQINLTKDEWWKDLPVLETVSKETLEKRLQIKLEAEEWVVCVKASQTTPDLDLDGRHGYLEIAIPTGPDSFSLYPFGNFAAHFPGSIKETVVFLANTVESKVAYPDENFFYSHRQHASHPIKLLPEKGKALMRILQQELIQARFGQGVFQFGAENCAFWVQKVLHKLDPSLPYFYRLDFAKSTPLNPILKGMFYVINGVPKNWQPTAIAAFDRLFGSHRIRRVVRDAEWQDVSHQTSPIRNEWVFDQPGRLHNLIQEKKLPGVIVHGNASL